MQLPNHLFFKLLLAFWLTTSLILVLVIGLPYLQEQLEREPIQPYQAQALERIATDMEIADGRALNSIGQLLRQQLTRQDREQRIQYFVLDANGQPVSTAPRNVPKEVRHFLLAEESYRSAMSWRFPNAVVFGPQIVYLKDSEYYLIGLQEAVNTRPMLFYLMEHPGSFLLVSIAFSGVVFGFMSWHLGKPLRQLRQTANALSMGDLDARVAPATLKRRDELGHLGASFNHMADSVSTMLKGQQRLLSDISHELRTPLTRMQLAMALTRKKQGDTPELQRIAREAGNLEDMIRELLALSRLNMQITEQKTELDLVQTLTPILDDARFEAEQMGKLLTVELPDSVRYYGLDTLLQRAVENPLRNALRYAESRVVVSMKVEEEEIVIDIQDDGPGVPESDLATIFKPFYRVDEARHRDSGGWGLGLAIAQAAIEAHQGRIDAQNRPPNGLCVSFYLPAYGNGHS
ncbi:ATP-binding protein [Ferrimonas marina]|uniref:histidine kinase n=1 Tax=Ferrimonas marina TaxID=299255 RepID=A0A1M5ZAP9_9GAMM|nr:ATP-binding protein [Ferrimonas marina]SHI21297.1 two-component system, OmpR family, sensor histidine kinase CpxA [Ferrimonas marina]